MTQTTFSEPHRNGVVLTTFNHAGGVAKSSLSRDLGWMLTQRGYKVLLIDADPQSSLSKWLGHHDAQDTETLRDCILHGQPLPQPRSWQGLSLISSNINLSETELTMQAVLGAEQRLRIALEEARRQYDVIIIDPGPNLGRLTLSTLVAADRLMVPLPTNSKGTDGMETIQKAISAVSYINPQLRIGAFVVTMYDQRNNHDRDMLKQYRTVLPSMHYAERVIGPVPLRSAAFKDSQLNHEPVLRTSTDKALHSALEDICDEAEQIVLRVRRMRVNQGLVPAGATEVQRGREDAVNAQQRVHA